MANDAQMPDVRRWDYYPIPMPLTADGKGPATVGVDAARIAYEVWDRDLSSHASYDNLPDAINEAMRLNAALPSDPAADLCASGQQVRALELRLRDWQGRAEMAGRALEAVLSGKPVRNADEIVSFCKTAALTPAPQPEGQVMDGWIDDKTFIEPLNHATPIYTGVKDKDGNKLYLGDSVRYLNEGPHTKKEYWNPEYEIVWNAPEFTLKHVGGGKDGGSHSFILKHGGGNGYLELVSRGNHTATPTAQEAVPVAYPHSSHNMRFTDSSHGDEICDNCMAIDPLRGKNFVLSQTCKAAHPPQPSETVAEAAETVVRLWRRGSYAATNSAVNILDAALRALKGDA